MNTTDLTIKTVACPKCKGDMILGFATDTGYGGEATSRQQRWVALIDATFFGQKINKRSKEFHVDSYACTNCGYLESYVLKEKPKDVRY